MDILDLEGNKNKLDELILTNINKENKNEELKSSSFYEKTTTFIYNKKWLIGIGVCILILLFIIYKYNISINIPLSFPCPMSKFKQKEETSCDDITEFNDDKDWNLEIEIQKYMELQDTYINTLVNK